MQVDATVDVERDLLSSALLAGAKVVDGLVTDLGVRPEHFAFESHRALFGAMVQLREADRPIDPSLLSAGGVDKAVISACLSSPAVGSHWAAYAGEVLRRYELRRLAEAGHLLVKAGDGDEGARVQAEGILSEPRAVRRRDVRDPQALGRAFVERLDTPGRSIPLPFPKLNELMSGGMRPGDVTLIGGPTNFGKSIVVDTILDHAVSSGFSAHLFDNEMMPEDRAARAISRMVGISVGKLTRGDLSLEERQLVEEAARELPFGVTDCTDWTIEDVCREVRRGRFDLYGLDILHNFPLRRREEWEDAALALKRAAHRGRVHLLVAVHVRKRGTGDDKNAVPELDDIAEAGGIKNRPANVIFVHRGMGDGGKQTDQSWLYLRKNRHGPLGRTDATFEGARGRVVEGTGH